MTNFCRPSLQTHLNRMLLQFLVGGAFTAIGLSGFTIDLSGRNPVLTLTSVAYAQDVGDEEVKSYAQAVLKAEPVRQTALDEIKGMVDSKNTSSIVCHNPQSLETLPDNAQKIAVGFCNQYKDIVESYGLTITRFNEITVNLQNSPNLEKRIKDELIRIQKASKSN